MARTVAYDLVLNDVEQNSGKTNGINWPGGIGKLLVSATFGGGKVDLQTLGPDGTTWIPVDAYAQVSAVSLTANGTATFIAPRGKLRIAITTATAVYARIVACPDNAGGE